MTADLQEVLKDIEHLVSLPAACTRLNDMMEDPSVSADDIGRVISQDVALTAKLLRVANSPLYGFSTQIGTVSRAVTILGTRQVRDLALASAAVKAFDGIPNDLVSMQGFWEHSILCALAARTLAMECLRRQREAVFVGALLHDIGQLVLYHRVPRLARQTLEACIDGPNELESQEAEQAIIGFDHAEVGSELAQRWNLPTNIQECIAYHHKPAEAKQNRVEVAIVHIANSIATLAELDSTDLENAPRILPIAWELTGLNKDIVEPTRASTLAQIADARSLFIER